LVEQWWLRKDLFEKAKQVLLGIEVEFIETGEIGTVFEACIQAPIKAGERGVRSDIPPMIILCVNFPDLSPEAPVKKYSRSVGIEKLRPINNQNE
jgi:hypothetical protein